MNAPCIQEEAVGARSGEPVMVLDGVSLRDEHDGHVLLDAVDFRAVPGRAAHVAVADDPRGARRLADVLCGIRMPDSGAARAFGRAWATCSPREAARMRARIGRVFSGAAWLSNLDMDENILLAARHHTGMADAELRARAEAWAVRFGLDGVPDGRPAWIDERTSLLAQWVRAFLLDPAVIVLQDPLAGAPRNAAPALGHALSEACGRGATVICMERESAPTSSAILPGCPDSYRLRAGRLHAVGDPAGREGGGEK